MPPHAHGGAAPAASTTVSCPADCPDDFVIEAPCRIIKAGGGHISISARELRHFPDGTYEWTATGNEKINLINAHSPTVTVESRENPSTGRDAEIITVTRTASGCPPVVKTVRVTVAKVTFSAAPNQRYGYDDFDTPDDPADDHICVKKSDHTFVHVDIEGGLVGTDFDFACESRRVCRAADPEGSASFNLQLNAGSRNKDSTILHARCTCHEATSFASIAVHVYKEKKVEVVVAKIGTNLRIPDADYASHEGDANDKLKQAVVKYDISNYESDNSVTRVHYDLDGNRVFTYDILNAGGAELDAIKRALRGTGRKTRVAIVREMKSYYYLSAAVNDTDTSVTVTASSVFNYDPNSPVLLGTGTTQETVYVTGSTGSTVHITRGTPAHPHGERDPLEYPAGGWACDPIIIIEGSVLLDTIKWTIIHEVGHHNLELRDVNDDTTIMHWQQPWSDQRLRYCPRTKQHETGTENQWDTIPR